MNDSRFFPSFIMMLAVFGGCAARQEPDDDPPVDAVSAQQTTAARRRDDDALRIVHDEYGCGRTASSDDVLLAPGLASEWTGIAGRTGDRVLAYTHYGWTLWNTRTRQVIVEGASEPAGVLNRPAMAGNVALVRPSSDEAIVLDVRDGTLGKRLTLPSTPRVSEMGLSVDGSYGWSANQDTEIVSVFSLEGAPLGQLSARVTSLAQVSAQPSATRVSKLSSIAQVSIPEGTATVIVPAHDGIFEGWFDDGEHFITLDLFHDDAQTLYVYRRDGTVVQTIPVSHYYHGRVGGYGRFFWTTHEKTLRVYRIGSSEPIVSRPLDPTGAWTWDDELFTQKGQMAVLGDRFGTVLRLDMRGEQLVFDELKLPETWVRNYASDDTGRWSVSTGGGVVYDSQTKDDAGRPLSLGCGTVRAIAGASSSIAAIATGDRRIRVFDLNAPRRAPLVTLEHESSELQLSRDGRRLLVASHSPSLQHVSDRGPRVVSLPDGKTIAKFPFQRDHGMTSRSIVLSENGARVAQLFCRGPNREDRMSLPKQTCAVQLSDHEGRLRATIEPIEFLAIESPNFWGYDPEVRMALSPSGNRVAITGIRQVPNTSSNVALTLEPVTLMFDEADQTGTGRGMLYVWLDDDRLMLSNGGSAADSLLLDHTGNVIATLPIDTTGARILRVDATHVYSVVDASLIAIPDGRVVWEGRPMVKSGEPPVGFAGDRIIFQTDTEVRVARWMQPQPSSR